ncbi:MAG: hypothetical protein J7J72_11520 [Bacteroidales bacterium]|nr:hypothetical protein [Bacteroidales bacterium]
MSWNSTLENLYTNKSQNKKIKNQEILSPDLQTIQNLLAYSKALSVLKSPKRMGKPLRSYRLILN